MSCDWNIYCQDCNDEHSFSDANHEEKVMQYLIDHAQCIAALAPLFEDIDCSGLWTGIQFHIYNGNIYPSWFKKHLGHYLLPRSEYGDLYVNGEIINKWKYNMKTEILVVPKNIKPVETFCHSCGHLRLWVREERPTQCGNCQSTNIEVDELNSKKLETLRSEWKY